MAELIDKGSGADVHNFDAGIAAHSMPYGASGTDIGLTVGVKHKFSVRMIGNAKVGYFDSDNITTGGNTNFLGPVGYLSLTYAL